MILRHPVQPIAFGVSFNLNLQSQSCWSLFDGTWRKRLRELEHGLSFEKEATTLQMQWVSMIDIFSLPQHTRIGCLCIITSATTHSTRMSMYYNVEYLPLLTLTECVIIAAHE